jgi:hypothetical protein
MDIDPLPGLLPSKVYVYVRKKFILLSLSCPLCPLNKPRTVFILGSLYFSKLFHLVQSTLLRFHFFCFSVYVLTFESKFCEKIQNVMHYIKKLYQDFF